MRSGVRHTLSAMVVTAVAVAIVGCSHDTLGSGTQQLSMSYAPNPAGAGRWDRATFDIERAEALPIDPAAPAIFEGDVLVFRFVNFSADLAATVAAPYSTIALKEGTYELTKFRITPPALVDTDIPVNPVNCIDGVTVLNSSSAPGVPASFEFVSSPELNFTVHPGQTTLDIKVNVPGLIAGYESAFTCQLGCGPGGAPCLTAFNAAAFRATVLANVKFE